MFLKGPGGPQFNSCPRNLLLIKNPYMSRQYSQSSCSHVTSCFLWMCQSLQTSFQEYFENKYFPPTSLVTSLIFRDECACIIRHHTILSQYTCLSLHGFKCLCWHIQFRSNLLSYNQPNKLCKYPTDQKPNVVKRQTKCRKATTQKVVKRQANYRLTVIARKGVKSHPYFFHVKERKKGNF